MKITIEDDNNRIITIEEPGVVSMNDFRELLISAALALGYHPDTVNNYLRPEEE